MAVSYVGAAAALTSSVSLPAHQADDLLLIFAAAVSDTPPSLPSGWTSLHDDNSGGGSRSIRCGYKIAAGSSETSGTWTGAARIIAQVYRGASAPSNKAGAKANSQTVTYAALTRTQPGTSWLAAFVFNLANADPQTPSGMTVKGSTSYVRGFDSNGVRATDWPATNVVEPASGNWLTVVLEVPVGVVTPVADFTGTPLTGEAPLEVAFTDESTNDPTAWAWDFGDSGTSTVQNPTYEYTAAGSYTVELEATNAAGSDTETKTGYVTVTLPPPGIEGFVVAFGDPTLEPDPTWTRLG
jgi:PKD repeat protein